MWLAKLLAEAPPREVLLHDVTDCDAGSLGALAQAELEAAGGSPRPLAGDERAALVRAWDALTGPTPERWVALLAEGHAVLHPLEALAYRFPDARAGVSAWELSLLRAVRDTDGRGARVIGTAMGVGLDLEPLRRDPRGDYTLTERLLALSNEARRHPLVQVEGDSSALRTMTVSLTDLGREVLDGRRCYLDLGDYEVDVCGFHIDAARPPVWQCDSGRIVLRPRG